MLKEPLLFASMIAGGSAFIGSAHGAFALDSPSPANLIVSEAPPPRPQVPPLSIDSDAEVAPVLILAPVVITPSAAVQARYASSSELRVCSDWTVVGAIYQTPAGASGLHHVRGLCY